VHSGGQICVPVAIPPALFLPNSTAELSTPGRAGLLWGSGAWVQPHIHRTGPGGGCILEAEIQ
jgi:hypothetical protein